MNYLPQQTVKYKTYVKTAMVEAFRDVFNHHVDEHLAKTKVTIDFPRTESDYPAVIVRFFEKEITNAGIGHEELIRLNNEDGSHAGTFKFKHYFYKGDIELAIYSLSSLDRDLIADSLVQTVAMGDLEAYTNRFFSRIYTSNRAQYPDAVSHYININADNIMGFGETQQNVPWQSEDDLLYLSNYRVSVFGEFYSLPPDLPAPFVERVLDYPYIESLEAVPIGDPNDGAGWEPVLDDPPNEFPSE